MVNDTNAANNSIPIVDVDPKTGGVFGQAASPPVGHLPGGIDDNNDDTFEAITDHISATDINTGSRSVASVLPSRMGRRLSDSPFDSTPLGRGFYPTGENTGSKL